MKYTILIGLILMMLVVAGCGSETPPEVEDDPIPEPPAPEVIEDERLLEDVETIPPEETVLSEVSETPSEFKVTYEMTATGVDEKQIMTQYTKGDNTRTDFEMNNMKSQNFLINGVYTMCNNAAGDWACMQTDMEVPDQKSMSDEAKNSISKESGALPAPSGTKEVAGESTDCYKIMTETISGEACFNKDGILLYNKGSMTAQGQTMTSEFIATSFSTTVPDSDFELPAAVATP